MKSYFLAICLLLVIFVITTRASATLISLDDSTFGIGSFTKDTATGLQWLDVSLTLNQSMNSIIANSGVGQEYAGLRYATQNEVAALYSDAGIYSAQTQVERYYAIYNLLGFIGYAPGYSNGGSRIIYGVTGTGPTDQFGHYISSYLWAIDSDPDLLGIYNLAIEVDGMRFGSDSKEAFLGSFLVRDQPIAPIPEPPTLILLGAGLAGTAFLRKKTD